VSRPVNLSQVLLAVCGVAFVLAAVIYNELTLGLFDPDPPLEVRTVTAIQRAQMVFLSIGIGLLVVQIFISRVRQIDTLTRRRWVARVLLTVLPVSSLILLLELGLQPFARTNLTTIFIEDETLGWKHKPHAHDEWGGSPVTINGKGLRGAELEYAKAPGVTRILYLGDSVTFGYRLPSDLQTFPYLVESILERKVEGEIESINAGVGGYSPWQEYAYLIHEGIKYDPDLIVVSFVLNDVTAKFGLIRFGGTSVGFELQNTVSAKFVKFFKGRSIAFFGRQILARLRFGTDLQRGAQRQENLGVEDLVFDSDRPFVRNAWDSTLRDLGSIFSYARTKGIPAVLVVFPYTFQFADPERLSTPQRVLSRYASEIGVPVVDLLPLLADAAERSTPHELFLDEDHLSEKGSRVVAELLADRFSALAIVKSRSCPGTCH
jgi:lysophospholipase L1-like esterase